MSLSGTVGLEALALQVFHTDRRVSSMRPMLTFETHHCPPEHLTLHLKPTFPLDFSFLQDSQPRSRRADFATPAKDPPSAHSPQRVPLRSQHQYDSKDFRPSRKRSKALVAKQPLHGASCLSGINTIVVNQCARSENMRNGAAPKQHESCEPRGNSSKICFKAYLSHHHQSFHLRAINKRGRHDEESMVHSPFSRRYTRLNRIRVRLERFQPAA